MINESNLPSLHSYLVNGDFDAAMKLFIDNAKLGDAYARCNASYFVISKLVDGEKYNLPINLAWDWLYELSSFGNGFATYLIGQEFLSKTDSTSRSKALHFLDLAESQGFRISDYINFNHSNQEYVDIMSS